MNQRPEKPEAPWWERTVTFMAWTLCAVVLILVMVWATLFVLDHVVQVMH